jgi:hypothetical protein
LRTIQVLLKTNQKANAEVHKVKIEQTVCYQAPPTPTHAETARVSTSTAPSSPLK